MDSSGNGYLKTVCDYVHLNPVRAKLLPLGGAIVPLPVEQLSRIPTE